MKDHDGGCNFIQIHCRGWRTNIPSPVSDQVFHAVVKPRVIKQTKIGYNSTWYQIVEQQSHGRVHILSMYQVLKILIIVLF